MTVILKAQYLSKRFEEPEKLCLFEGVSLELHQGQSIAIIGKSGSGKSSLLHILGTLDRPSSGSLWIHEQEAWDARQKLRQNHLGFVFQSFHLLEDYTLLENVLMPAFIARRPIHQQSPSYQKAIEMLAFVDLLEKAAMPAKLLSGGEKQRASLARAFSNDPDLLLVDEPTGSLDPLNAKRVEDLLLRGCKEHGKALILVTHDEELAYRCDQVFLLKQGSLTPVTPEKPL